MIRIAALTLLAITLAAQQRAPVTSHITIVSADGSARQVIYSSSDTFEAPNWSPDGKYLLLNSQGKLWRMPVSGGEPVTVPLGVVKGVNNDHGISPDGKWFAISAQHLFV